jgi:hypothetical protein
MQIQIENREQYQLVAVRRDGTEVVLVSNLSRVRADSVRASLVDSRAFADLRVEPAKKKCDQHIADSADPTSRAPAGIARARARLSPLEVRRETTRPAPAAFVGQQERHEAGPRQNIPGGQERRDD